MIYLVRIVLHLAHESWSRSCNKTKTKTLTSKTEAKAKTSTFKAKAKTKSKAVKICLEAASRRGTALRHHITGSWFKVLDVFDNLRQRLLPADWGNWSAELIATVG